MVPGNKGQEAELSGQTAGPISVVWLVLGLLHHEVHALCAVRPGFPVSLSFLFTILSFSSGSIS